jgi:hypothetical protein
LAMQTANFPLTVIEISEETRLVTGRP